MPSWPRRPTAQGAARVRSYVDNSRPRARGLIGQLALQHTPRPASTTDQSKDGLHAGSRAAPRSRDGCVHNLGLPSLILAGRDYTAAMLPLAYP